MKPRFTYWRRRWWVAIHLSNRWWDIGSGPTPRAAWDDAAQWVERVEAALARRP